ncbi:uncharacterized protein [Apostichopus japonicus]|uniref:uncharacterized protein n=1 Tax=Stichopus japonicus TaxID=307972 RepID=UPI003AB81966
MRKRRRGKAGGVKKRQKRCKGKPFLPSIIMGNVRSLNNKIDELQANARYFQEFRDISLMSFTETWLNDNITDESMYIDGFKLLRGDRNLDLAAKQKGGGVCLYVNNRWCHPNNAILKGHFCSPNIEILTVGLRPYYIPREFSHVIHLTVYIPNRNVARDAAKDLSTVIQDLEIAHPYAFIVIDGDFNHTNLKKTDVHYYQHVNCPTREEATLDLCYSNVKDAYNAVSISPLGESDHNLVILYPRYRPIVLRQKPAVITVQQWSQESLDQLQSTLDTTDWDMFIRSSSDIDELTDAITGYVNFCVDCSVPTKQVKVYPNNKPWITSTVKSVINRKKGIFGRGDRAELKAVQKELKDCIRKEKAIYKRKIENRFIENNMKEVWEGIRLMSGYMVNNHKSYLPDTSIDYANALNDFYNRFDCHDFSTQADLLRESLDDCAGGKPFLCVTRGEVYREFSRLNAFKAPGPDQLKPRVLKTCANQLADIFTHIFNLSFCTKTIPVSWKRSCIIPVAKKAVISCMNDLRPVALTSVLMKSCERIVLRHIKPLVDDYLDPQQYAYRAHRNTEDAVLNCLEKLYSHPS